MQGSAVNVSRAGWDMTAAYLHASLSVCMASVWHLISVSAMMDGVEACVMLVRDIQLSAIIAFMGPARDLMNVNVLKDGKEIIAILLRVCHLV